MARCRTGWRWLNAAAVVAMLAVVPCAAQAPPVAFPEKVNKDKKIQMQIAPAPNPALLDYLARYPEAADGLDPLGLADGEAAAATRGADEHESGGQQ